MAASVSTHVVDLRGARAPSRISYDVRVAQTYKWVNELDDLAAAVEKTEHNAAVTQSAIERRCPHAVS
jgi:hypothetical protein